jgi:hypothetical protein
MYCFNNLALFALVFGFFTCFTIRPFYQNVKIVVFYSSSLAMLCKQLIGEDKSSLPYLFLENISYFIIIFTPKHVNKIK